MKTTMKEATKKNTFSIQLIVKKKTEVLLKNFPDWHIHKLCSGQKIKKLFEPLRWNRSNFVKCLGLIAIALTILGCTKKTEESKKPECDCLGCETGIITDADNNSYKTIRICDTWWMARNLATTHFNDGTLILNIIDDLTWETTSSPAYCAYNNDYINNYFIYGALYNFYAVETQKLCPVGWHVASYKDWVSLAEAMGDTDYLTGDILTGRSGGKLKEKGTTHWKNPNNAASDTAGFTALPGGLRSTSTGVYYELGTSGFWHSSDINEYGVMVDFQILNDKSYLTNGTGGAKNNGFSVRCVRNN